MSPGTDAIERWFKRLDLNDPAARGSNLQTRQRRSDPRCDAPNRGVLAGILTA